MGSARNARGRCAVCADERRTRARAQGRYHPPRDARAACTPRRMTHRERLARRDTPHTPRHTAHDRSIFCHFMGLKRHFMGLKRHFMGRNRRFMPIECRFMGTNSRFMPIEREFMGTNSRLMGTEREFMGTKRKFGGVGRRPPRVRRAIGKLGPVAVHSVSCLPPVPKETSMCSEEPMAVRRMVCNEYRAHTCVGRGRLLAMAGNRRPSGDRVHSKPHYHDPCRPAGKTCRDRD